MSVENRYVLLVTSPDQKGLVYKISSVLYDSRVNVEKNDEFVDPEHNKFFMRTAFTGDIDASVLQAEVKTVLPADAEVILLLKRPKKIVLMGTKESHCLGDILIRYDSGELNAEIQAVISNHDALRSLSERFSLPFHHVSHEGCSREEHEAEVLKLLQQYAPDYVVLAKYMRILSPEFVRHFANQIINIHHSFLPAFIGANPYKQAYERGVKIIGATAHFVNDDLDEGPIIAQDIEQVDHSYGWKDMQKVGRDVEKVVLSKALNLALEDRIFVYGNKTVVF